MDGLTLLRRLRGGGNHANVLLLTAKDSIEDRVAGLDAGADDYLVKPFSFDELLARVRALLRRQSEVRNPILKLDDLVMDTASKTVQRAGKKLLLTSKGVRSAGVPAAPSRTDPDPLPDLRSCLEL